MSDQQLIKVNNLMMRYSPLHDRILLVGFSDNEKIVSAWFTQRFISIFIKKLASFFYEISGESRNLFIEDFKVGNDQNNINIKKIKLFIREYKDGHEDSFLILGAKFKKNKNQLILVFQLKDSQSLLAIQLNQHNLKKWLEMLFQQTHEASWPDSIWPAWLRQEIMPNTEVVKKLH